MSLGPAARLGWGWPGVGDPSVPEPEDLLRGMEVEISLRRPAHCRSNEKRGERGLSKIGRPKAPREEQIRWDQCLIWVERDSGDTLSAL